jgi:UPF0716 protein FxsA
MRFGLFIFLWFSGEVVALIEVGSRLGAIQTLALLVLGSGLGAALLRAEGVAFFARVGAIAQRYGVEGEVPPLPVAESVPRFLAGALLLVPGFISDALAILVLLPPLRGMVAGRVRRWIEDRHHQAVSRASFTTIDIDAEIAPDDAGEGPERDPPRMPRRIP